ncbi:MAG: hypothetical protein CM15mP55_2620 [Hyphomicrobiales bacterium]|nr:MAG: hypothetical protein CM15mP55_2620 [Hyphomicrobiales bacterium]
MKGGLIYDPPEYDPEGYPITHNLILDRSKPFLLGKPQKIFPFSFSHFSTGRTPPCRGNCPFGPGPKALPRDVEMHFLKGGTPGFSEPHQIDGYPGLSKSFWTKTQKTKTPLLKKAVGPFPWVGYEKG